ncbi:hypothetical protein LCGC14_0403190 [marine sediment metagenome]|uniref:Uncharacterized protein n=1 Tax=marine sediment metagenome TaxID=412755 RepID=A0A0F9TE05_9ZZZZ
MAFKIIRFCKDELDFSCKVNIDQQGIFTAYLPEDIVAVFENAGISLEQNPARRTRAGFFSDETMHGLKKQIGAVLVEYFSKEEIDDKIVIRYDIQTTCAYCLDIHGNIVPNGQEEWVLSNEYSWQTGTIGQDAAHSKPYGILVYARLFRKRQYQYKSGKIKTEYDGIYTNGLKKGDFLYHLASFSSMETPDGYGENLKEIDYTEETAEFFVNLLTSICRLSENIKGRLDPKSILKMIELKQKLLT